MRICNDIPIIYNKQKRVSRGTLLLITRTEINKYHNRFTFLFHQKPVPNFIEICSEMVSGHLNITFGGCGKCILSDILLLGNLQTKGKKSPYFQSFTRSYLFDENFFYARLLKNLHVSLPP